MAGVPVRGVKDESDNSKMYLKNAKMTLSDG